MQIAILALQGAFREHAETLDKCGVNWFELRKKSDLDRQFDGLILPGGESTVQGKLLREIGMFDEIKSRIEGGLPVFGTCAGLILLAKKLLNDDRVHISTMDITAVRNAYGRQMGSFYTEDYFDGVKIPMTFIRAPYIESVGEGVKVLAKVDGKITAAVQKNQLVCTFHPELGDNLYVHEYFLNMVRAR